jgi:hypothetical protein
MPARTLSRSLLPAIAALACALGPRSAETAPLPRVAVSVPHGVAPAEACRVIEDSRLNEAVVVLPVAGARVGGEGSVPATPELPPGRFFLHLRLEIGPVPGSGHEREALVERQLNDIVAALRVDRPAIAGVIVEPAGAGPPEDVLQFALAMLMVRLKASSPSLEVALVLPDGMADRSFDAAARLMAYADSLVVPASALAGFGSSRLEAVAAGKPIVARVSSAPDGGTASAARAWLDMLISPGASFAGTAWVETDGLPALRALCDSVRVVSRSLGSGLEMTASERAPLAVMADGHPVSPSVAFVGGQTADIAFLLRVGSSPGAPRSLTLASSAAKIAHVTCVDAVSGRSLDQGPVAGAAPGCRADAEYVLLRARVPTGDDRLFEAVRVTGRSSLRVEEIIARWQAVREVQRLLLDNYSVPCFLGIHFEITNLAETFDIALELREFADRSGVQDWVQTAFRVNGVKLRRGQEFPLPQIEPDKVVTRPLELRIDEKYAYELVGTETVNGRLCYVVAIRPAQPSDALYSGKVWIDGIDFRQVRLRLEQRDGKNNVAAHVETQEFGPVRDGQGRSFNLVRSIYAEDSINLAGRSITIEKRYLFGEYAVNASDFAAKLGAARESDDPMFRDTEDGLRALRKNQGGQRVVEPVVGKRVRALLGGLVYDGSYSVPIPLAGLSWVDFDWHKTGMQLSAFFAGPILIADLSRQVSKNLRWGVDLSATALPYTYYEYAGNREVAARRVRGFQQFIGGLLNWQVTPELDLSTQADVFYNIYQATRETDPGYRVPASGVTLDVYAEAKYVRKGFSAIATVENGQRLGWRDFGYVNDPEVTYPDWTRYSLELSQHVFVGKLTRGGVSAGYFGGSHLDRFSQYSPSFLGRPTMHGIPSGIDSFDQVTTLSGYYGFNVADLAKLQGFYTHAWTRNRFEGTGIRQFDGLDASIGIAGPFGTFVQGSVSFAIRGNLERYASRWGTYLVFLKPLKK